MLRRSFEGRPEPTEAESLVLLSHRIRRRTLETLQQHGGALGVAELLAKLVADEEQTGPDSRRHLEAELRDEHLPRLEAAGVVDVDASADTVRPGVNFDRIGAVLASTTAADLPWVESSPTAVEPDRP